MNGNASGWAAGKWLSFHDYYCTRSPEGGTDTAAYELFNYFRDAGPAMWVREPFKAIYHAWLTSRSPKLDVPRVHFDYCFIIDGTGVPGLATSHPLLRSLPADKRALLVMRDYVVRDSRIEELRRLPQFTIVNIDRVRPRSLSLGEWWRATVSLLRRFPRAWVTLPQLALRRLKYQQVLAELLDNARVRHLVVSNERLLLSSAAIHAAKQRGIHTACLQHGALVDEYLPVTVDTYLVWGEEAADWLRRRNVTASLVTIGSPRTDKVAQYLGPDTEAGRTNDSRRVVVFFTQPDRLDVPTASHERVAREFLKLLSDPDLKVCIKLHPSDDRARWVSLAAGERDRLHILDATADLYRVLRDADYAGAFYSTVLVEAMLFTRPVFQLNPFPADVADYSGRAGCAHVESGDELRAWIRHCEAQPDFRARAIERQSEYARRYFARVGNATAEFFRCMDSLPRPAAGLPT